MQRLAYELEEHYKQAEQITAIIEMMLEAVENGNPTKEGIKYSLYRVYESMNSLKDDLLDDKNYAFDRLKEETPEPTKHTGGINESHKSDNNINIS